MNTELMFSSKNMDWETPDELFNKLNDVFMFTLDVCATKENTKVRKFFSKEEDGLSQSWEGEVCWMNPPYGREIGKWLRKAYEESRKRVTVVCLIPARTDTSYWHDYCLRAYEICFIRGRIRFKNGLHAAPFPSAIVIFTSRNNFSPIISSMDCALLKESVRDKN